MSKRIALCLSGIVGGTGGRNGAGDVVDIQTIYNQYDKHILSKNDVDVFVHSWSVDSEDILTDLYKPKRKMFEPQVDFREIAKKNKHKNLDASHIFYSRWNSIKRCVQLKIEYEEDNNFEYDMVMISRFDLLWFTDVIFDDYHSNYFWVSNWNENGPLKMGPYDKQSNAGTGYLDFWFFSNSVNIDKFSYMYDNLSNGKFFEVFPSRRLSGHVTSKQFANLLELDVRKTMYRGYDHEVYRRYNEYCGEKI